MGRVLTLALAQAGANVVIHYHSSREGALQTAREAREYGVRAMTARADLAKSAQVEKMAERVKRSFDAVDILVHSASPFEITRLPVQDYQAWKQVTGVLIDGGFYCANLFAPGMRERGEGAIINIVDLSVFQPWPNFSAHGVGKAGLDALTRQLAVEYAPQVRVNSIAPGPVLPPEDYSEQKIAMAAKRTLLKRWGSPQDVADAMLFLLRADFITGITLPVDGGELLSARAGKSAS